MPRDRELVTKNENGDEQHPAFGMTRVGRIRSSPGAILFQSDLQHREYLEFTISTASRNRDVANDWVHAGRTICTFSLSSAQFASLVASVGTEGVPVTLDYYDGQPQPGLPYEPRLGVSMDEVSAAAEAAFSEIRERLAFYETELAEHAPAARRKNALARLRAAVGNATANVDYTAKMLAEHAESVVEKSRADIEAMIVTSSHQQPPWLAWGKKKAIGRGQEAEADDA